MDHTYQRGTKYIDLIEATKNIINFIKDSRLYKINKIINTDYRAYVVDINFEYYFEEEFSRQDKIDKAVLSLNKRIHREKFNE